VLYTPASGRNSRFHLLPVALGVRQTDVRPEERGEDDGDKDQDSSHRKDRFGKRGDGVAVNHPEYDRLKDNIRDRILRDSLRLETYPEDSLGYRLEDGDGTK
jgi:hypothetical protein